MKNEIKNSVDAETADETQMKRDSAHYKIC